MSPSEFTVPDDLVRRIARGRTSLADAQRECDAIVGAVTRSSASMKQALSALVKYAKDHKERESSTADSVGCWSWRQRCSAIALSTA